MDNKTETTGGGIYNDEAGSLELRNAIVADNQGGDCAGSITSLGHNLDSDGTCGLSAAGDIAGADPMLSLLVPGGSAPVHVPMPGSPAIDSGDPLSCPKSDQRGLPRPQDGDGDSKAVCDIGSVEVGSCGPPVCYPHGDADCNEAIESSDGLDALRFAASLRPDAACIGLADVDCDGDIDIIDALFILRFVAALPVTLPPNCPTIGTT